MSELAEPGSASAHAEWGIAHAEWGIVLVAVALRVRAVVLAVVGVPRGLMVAEHRVLYAATALGALGVSGWLVVSAVRHRDLRRGRWHPADLAVGALALLALGWALPADELVGTQAAWAPGFSLNVACLAGGYLSRSAATV